jgi:hypothetical protein
MIYQVLSLFNFPIGGWLFNLASKGGRVILPIGSFEIPTSVAALSPECHS